MNPDDVKALARGVTAAKTTEVARKDRDKQLRAQMYELMQAMGVGRFDVTDPDDGADLGTVILTRAGLVVTITDPDKFKAWVADHRPEELVTTTAVRDSYQKAVLDGVEKRGEAVDADGNQIPGVSVGPKAPVLTVTPTPVAYARARQQLDG